MINHQRILSRLVNTPLMLHEGKLAAIESALLPLIVGGTAPEIDTASIFSESEADQKSRHEAFLPRFSSATRDGYFLVGSGTAVISITGTLIAKGAYTGAYSGLTSYEGISELLNRALDSAEVDQIVLNLHSWGGEVMGCFDLVDEIYEARERKPITALVADAGTSACYAIASAASEVVATQTAMIGSIGVVMTHFDYSQYLANEGIVPTHIKSGTEKTLGSPYEPLSDEDRKKLKAEVDECAEMFFAKVKRNRGIEVGAIRDQQAAIYGPDEAIKRGLADRLSSGRELLNELSGHSSTSGTPRSTLRSSDMNRKDQGPNAEKATDDDTKEKAQAFESGVKQGATNERSRIAAILNCEEADGRRKQAEHIALETDMKVESAVAMLGASPKEQPAKSGLADAMAKAEQPDVGPGGDAPDSDESQAQALADQIINA